MEPPNRTFPRMHPGADAQSVPCCRENRNIDPPPSAVMDLFRIIPETHLFPWFRFSTDTHSFNPRRRTASSDCLHLGRTFTQSSRKTLCPVSGSPFPRGESPFAPGARQEARRECRARFARDTRRDSCIPQSRSRRCAALPPG